MIEPNEQHPLNSATGGRQSSMRAIRRNSGEGLSLRGMKELGEVVGSSRVRTIFQETTPSARAGCAVIRENILEKRESRREKI